MRVGAGLAACGGLALLLSAHAPAAAQQAAGGAAEASASAYATQLRDTEARLNTAIEQAQRSGTRTQAGAMPPSQQQLMDATQAAWQALQNGATDATRGGGPYEEADRTFRRAVEAMRVGNTPPDQAVAAARDAHAALGRLRQSVAGDAGTGANAPTPSAAGQGPIQEPARR